MIDRIDNMLESIIDRIEKALPNVTSIDKVMDITNILVSIKNLAVTASAPVLADNSIISDEI